MTRPVAPGGKKPGPGKPGLKTPMRVNNPVVGGRGIFGVGISSGRPKPTPGLKTPMRVNNPVIGGRGISGVGISSGKKK
jgi:hypothetical protein